MNILIVNGSPKGKNSISLQTPLYLAKRYPAHRFEVLPAAVRIKGYEKDFSAAKAALEAADLVLFAYPVYTFLAPYQLHRFVELMKENDVALSGKWASQITTSKHFYDVTAHGWLEENCYDFGMKYSDGLSADMEDLLCEKGQREAESYFEKMMFDVAHDIYKARIARPALPQKPPYQPVHAAAQTPSACAEKLTEKRVVLVTNAATSDENLNNMIADFVAVAPYAVKTVNTRAYPFSGGCLGCLSCATSAHCVYQDGFEDYLRGEIQTADAIVYAFTIENHFTEASLKCYDDRQFCNGHRTVTHGMPVGYLISGDYHGEANLKMLVEARSEVGGVYLCGVATDEMETRTATAIANLAASLTYALTHVIARSPNFYGVGGSKIFRDLVYLMQGFMKADHQFYKAHGVYDFPHNQRLKIIKMQLIGGLLGVPAVQKKTKGKLSGIILEPYTKLIDTTNAKE